MGIADYEMKNQELLDASLKHLADEIVRVMENVSQQEYNPPIYNYSTQFEIPEFKLRAYDWGWVEESLLENEEPPANFEWRDYKLWWYKRLGRGDWANREITNDELSEMLNECIPAVRELEKELDKHEKFFRSEKWKWGDFYDKEKGIHIR